VFPNKKLTGMKAVSKKEGFCLLSTSTIAIGKLKASTPNIQGRKIEALKENPAQTTTKAT